MSKPFDQLTKTELSYMIHDILEHDHQWTDPYCPWCGARDYGVGADGKPTEDVDLIDEYHIDHLPECATSLIEAIYNGTYEYVNKPKWED
jgi:hypothetical protein